MNKDLALVLAFACCALRVNAVIEDPAWVSFKKEFGKSYATEDEDAARYEIFKNTLGIIKSFNEKNLSYTLRVTEFADRTRQEFSDKLNSPPEPLGDSSGNKVHVPYVPEGVTDLPPDVDWVKSHALRPIKNQGHCEVCWAFAATAALEAAQHIRKGAVGWKDAVVSLSEQQAIDCIGNGCDSGGFSQHWWSHLADNRVEVCTEEELPFQDVPHYKAACQEGNKTCDNGLDEGSVSGVVSVKSESDLLSAIYQQPAKIDINAGIFPHEYGDSGPAMLALYSGGIIDVPCSGHTDHSVVVVGYGTENGMDYWKVRNSWGADWGEGGYFRLKRNNGDKGSMCMMTNGGPMYPSLQGAAACDDGFSTEWNYGYQSACECNNPDGSKRNNCMKCCKITDEGKYIIGRTGSCRFGFSKAWNYACQSRCGCNNPDGSPKFECDKCCKLTADYKCAYHDSVQENNATTFTGTVTPRPINGNLV